MYEVTINGKTKTVDEKRLNLIKIVYGKAVLIEKAVTVKETVEPQKIVKSKKRKNGSL